MFIFNHNAKNIFNSLLITYVISLPPLSFGAFQDNVTELAVISSYVSGASGGPGLSVDHLSLFNYDIMNIK